MNNRYDDIKNMSRPKYEEFPPMDISDRVAQFSPFAALTGYGDAIEETERIVEEEMLRHEINT